MSAPESGIRSSIRTKMVFSMMPSPAPNRHMATITTTGWLIAASPASPKKAITSAGISSRAWPRASPYRPASQRPVVAATA
ncbi:MAG: hypothetical protein ABSA93_19015 [Streptosporangiaceae bacterium]